MGRRVRASTYAWFGVLFAATVFLSHATLITMPYFWDEAGSTIPAAQAIVDHGLQPAPAVSYYVAAAWKLFGDGEATARVAMLLLASLTLLGSFLLAIELCGSLPGVPALISVGLLAATPLFYTQCMLVTSAVPAMLSAVFGLWFYVRRKYKLAAVALLLLIVVLASGGLGFSATALNPRHPGRIAVNAAARLVFFGLADLRLLGLVGVALAWRAKLLDAPRWKAAGIFSATYLLATLPLKAALDRDMLPLLPIFYTAAVVGFSRIGPRLQTMVCGLLLAALIAGLWVNPPFWPQALENNLAMADFTVLQKRTARYMEQKWPGRNIVTAWPLSDALRKPALGYVKRPMAVVELADFSRGKVAKVPRDAADVYVRFSRFSDPPDNVMMSNRYTRFIAHHYMGIQEAMDQDEIERALKMKLAVAWEQRGQRVEIYEKGP